MGWDVSVGCDLFVCRVCVVTDVVYLLAWIASARTAVPRNDGVDMDLVLMAEVNVASRHCEFATKQSIQASKLQAGQSNPLFKKNDFYFFLDILKCYDYYL